MGVFVDADGSVTAAEWIEGAISRTVDNSRVGSAREEASHANQTARSKKMLLMQMLKANSVVIQVRFLSVPVSLPCSPVSCVACGLPKPSGPRVTLPQVICVGADTMSENA